MSDDRIKTEKAALTADADAWMCLATAQRRLADAVSDLDLRFSDLNPRADSKTMAYLKYRTFVTQLEETLNKGSHVVADASQALVDIRNAYALTEGAADDLALQLIKEIDTWSAQ